MTKQELLQVMAKHCACRQATQYVTDHASDDAAEIGGTCTDVSWLIWLLGRELRLARFVRVCAKRAAKAAPGSVRAERAAHYAAVYYYAAADYADAGAAYYAAADAAYYADAAAAAAERAAQLKGLQRIFRDWANGKEAEK